MSFVESEDPSIPNRTGVQQAMPLPKQGFAPPIPHPRALPGPAAANTPWDIIVQALSQMGPKFLAKAEAQAAQRMPQLDAKIAQMQANNAAVAERLKNMKLGAEALDAAPRVAAKPIGPLDLFGGPTPEPPKVRPPGTPPTSQEFMQEHNARTPRKVKGRGGPEGPSAPPVDPPISFDTPPPRPPILPQAHAPLQQIPRLPQVALAEPPDWRRRAAAVAAALGQSLAQDSRPEPINWLQRRPRVYQRKG